VSNPQPPGQQWDSPEQTDQSRWQPGWPESQSEWPQPEPQVAWSQPDPQVDWDAQTQVGWDQQAPQAGWSQPDPSYEAQYSGDWPSDPQPDASSWPASPQPDGGAHRHYQASAHTQVYTGVRVLAQLACLALIIVGLSVREDGIRGWTDLTAWAIFAAAAAVVQATPLIGRGFGLDVATSWTVGAVATASLVAYWVLIVLPSVGTDAGFTLTMGTAAAVIGSWLSPGRQL